MRWVQKALARHTHLGLAAISCGEFCARHLHQAVTAERNPLRRGRTACWACCACHACCACSWLQGSRCDAAAAAVAAFRDCLSQQVGQPRLAAIVRQLPAVPALSPVVPAGGHLLLRLRLLSQQGRASRKCVRRCCTSRGRQKQQGITQGEPVPIHGQLAAVGAAVARPPVASGQAGGRALGCDGLRWGRVFCWCCWRCCWRGDLRSCCDLRTCLPSCCHWRCLHGCCCCCGHWPCLCSCCCTCCCHWLCFRRCCCCGRCWPAGFRDCCRPLHCAHGPPASLGLAAAAAAVPMAPPASLGVAAAEAAADAAADLAAFLSAACCPRTYSSCARPAPRTAVIC